MGIGPISFTSLTHSSWGTYWPSAVGSFSVVITSNFALRLANSCWRWANRTSSVVAIGEKSGGKDLSISNSFWNALPGRGERKRRTFRIAE
jgi:hypothetical protein